MKLETYEVSKLEAVKQQIDEAILMFFNRRNSIVIHTIVGAAHQVLHDLADRENSMIKNDRAAESSGKGKTWYTRLNKEYNFFKHAEKDKNEKIMFDPLLFTYYLIDCVYMYRALTNTSPHSHKVFDMWFALSNTEAIGDQEVRRVAEQLSEKEVDPENYEYFIGLIKNHG